MPSSQRTLVVGEDFTHWCWHFWLLFSLSLCLRALRSHLWCFGLPRVFFSLLFICCRWIGFFLFFIVFSAGPIVRNSEHVVPLQYGPELTLVRRGCSPLDTAHFPLAEHLESSWQFFYLGIPGHLVCRGGCCTLLWSTLRVFRRYACG